MKKKKGVYCSVCESEITIAKKGRKKFYICPRCGVIAHNPAPLIGMALSALTPTLIEKGKKLISGKGESAEVGGASPKQKIISDSLDKPNKSERYVNMALRG